MKNLEIKSKVVFDTKTSTFVEKPAVYVEADAGSLWTLEELQFRIKQVLVDYEFQNRLILQSVVGAAEAAQDRLKLLSALTVASTVFSQYLR